MKTGKKCIRTLLFTFAALLFFFPRRVSASVSVIGGADGPTSIFIAGKTSPVALALGALLLLLVGIVVFIIVKNKKGKKK